MRAAVRFARFDGILSAADPVTHFDGDLLPIKADRIRGWWFPLSAADALRHAFLR